MAKKVIAFLLIWLAFAGLALFWFSDRWPESAWHWLLLIVLGPPAFALISLVGEGLGELFRFVTGISRVDNLVEKRTRTQRLSGLRILWYLLTSLLWLTVIVAIVYVARTYL